MLIFIMIFFQIFTLVLGTFILCDKKLGIGLFIFMLIIGFGIGLPLYLALGAMGIIFVIFFMMVCLTLKNKKILSNAILLMSAIIIFNLGGYVAPLLSNLFVREPIEILQDNSKFIIGTVILGSIISLTLFIVVRLIIDKWELYYLFDKRYRLLVFIFGLATVSIFYVNIFLESRYGVSVKNSRINSFIFLLYAGLSAGMYVTLFRLESKNRQIENEKIQKEQLRDYTIELELQYEEIRKVRHDFVNILLTMTDYLNHKDIEGLSEFFTEKIIPIENKLQENNSQLALLAKIKIPEVKGVVSNKLLKAQSMNINISIEINKTLEEINMDTMTLCRSLGIILDNAIEEAQLSKTPYIEIAFIIFNNTTMIVTRNSYFHKIKSIEQLYQNGFSTKGEDRGRGLSILREIIRTEENAYLSTYIKKDYFIQEIEIRREE